MQCQGYPSDAYPLGTVEPAYSPSGGPPPSNTTALLYTPAGENKDAYQSPSAPGYGTTEQSAYKGDIGNFASGQGQNYYSPEGYPANTPYMPPAPAEQGHGNYGNSPPYPFDSGNGHGVSKY